MVISGVHAIKEALKNGYGKELFLSTKDSCTLKLEEYACRVRVKVSYISLQEMNIIGGSSNNKALLEIYPLSRRNNHLVQSVTLDDYINQWRYQKDVLVLLLDGITDVRNFGAILRSADKFEVNLVIIPKNRSAKIGEGSYRTSSGASEYVPQLIVTNLRQTIVNLKKVGFWIYTADLDGMDLDSEKLANNKIAIIMGSENKGPRTLTRKMSDGVLTVPCRGHIDSLNVSVAAGIILYEVRRQQKFFK